MKFEVNRINMFGDILQIQMPKHLLQDVEPLQKAICDGKKLSVDISVKRKKRSLNANAYCWILCQAIAAEELSKNGYTSKEDVYRQAIRHSIKPDYICCKNEAVEALENKWQKNGIGWFTENYGASKNVQGCTVLALYSGSSTFDTKEMSRLIECLIDECKRLGIEVMNESEKNLLLQEWGGKNYG